MVDDGAPVGNPRAAGYSRSGVLALSMGILCLVVPSPFGLIAGIVAIIAARNTREELQQTPGMWAGWFVVAVLGAVVGAVIAWLGM
jgi:hypothetical protein